MKKAAKPTNTTSKATGRKFNNDPFPAWRATCPPGSSPELYTQFGETADTWKASLDGANDTGWEAYATLLSGVSSDTFPENR